MNRFIRIAAPAALLLAAAASPVAADEQIPTVMLDLSGVETVEGAREIYRTLERDAYDTCNIYGSGRKTLRQSSIIRTCATQLVAKAVKKVDRPLLTALHDGAPTRLASAEK